MPTERHSKRNAKSRSGFLETRIRTSQFVDTNKACETSESLPRLVDHVLPLSLSHFVPLSLRSCTTFFAPFLSFLLLLLQNVFNCIRFGICIRSIIRGFLCVRVRQEKCIYLTYLFSIIVIIAWNFNFTYLTMFLMCHVCKRKSKYLDDKLMIKVAICSSFFFFVFTSSNLYSFVALYCLVYSYGL